MNNGQNNWVRIGVASILWMFLWSVTQGFFMREEMWNLIPGTLDMQASILTLYIALLVVLTLAVQVNLGNRLLVKSRIMWIYAAPIALIAALPLHYELVLSIPVFVGMVVITTFWQDYITFVLLQTHIQKSLTPVVSVSTVGSVFVLGHLAFSLDELTYASIPLWLGLAAAGFFFAALRQWTGNIYAVHILHMSFLLIFV